MAELIKNLTEACERCCKGSGLPAKVVANELEIDYTAFVRMFNENDPRHFPPDKIIELMRVCDSLLPLEWLAGQMGLSLHEKSLHEYLVAIAGVISKDGVGPKFSILDSGTVIRNGGCDG